MSKLSDRAKFELNELKRKKNRILSREEVADIIIRESKRGRKRITKHRKKLDGGTVEWLIGEGIQVVDDFIPKNFLKRLIQRLFRVKCIHFIWDEDEEYRKNKEKQAMISKYEEEILKLKDDLSSLKNEIKEKIVIE